MKCLEYFKERKLWLILVSVQAPHFFIPLLLFVITGSRKRKFKFLFIKQPVMFCFGVESPAKCSQKCALFWMRVMVLWVMYYFSGYLYLSQVYRDCSTQVLNTLNESVITDIKCQKKADMGIPIRFWEE